MEIVLNNPVVLVLLLLIPILVVLHYYFFEHNKRKAMKFANFSAMKRVTGTHLITKNNGQLIFRCTTFAMLVLSASQPVFWYEGKASVTDYVIAIDSSASMVSVDVLPDRLSVAKIVAASFLDKLDASTNLGLVSFSGVSIIKSPLITDKKKLKDEITNIDIELSGGTDIGGALITGTNILIPGQKAKTIILITDGSDTAGSFIQESVDTALEYVAASHIIVHTVLIGTGTAPAGYVQDVPLKAIIDKDTLKKVSDRTGGQSYEVKSTAEAAMALKDLVTESDKAKLSYQLGPLLMAIGLILLIAEWVLLNTRFRALP